MHNGGVDAGAYACVCGCVSFSSEWSFLLKSYFTIPTAQTLNLFILLWLYFGLHIGLHRCLHSGLHNGIIMDWSFLLESYCRNPTAQTLNLFMLPWLYFGLHICLHMGLHSALHSSLRRPRQWPAQRLAQSVHRDLRFTQFEVCISI